MCIGRKKGGQLTTLSMHGASINPERPNYTRFVDDVCTVTDVPEDSTGSEGYIRVDTEMCSIGESQEARMDYQRIFNSVEGTSFYVRLRRSSRFYHLDKLKPIAMQKLNLPHCQRDGMFVGTFESHSPDPWRVDVQEFNCRASRRGLSKLTGRDRPVRQLKAIFKIKRENGEWETVPILGTVNNIMKLDTTRGHGADASTWTQAEAFFFEFYSRNEFFDAVMITSGGKPVMLFDTRIKPQQQLQHL
ncbi:hypothetical protein Pmar_PMAR024885 [Perkinsus marinus ATCC 50983]|uniref:Uncharacterized protein n=1 Tax=Perkinsus marinus (strain ATCC 50983 / TXsc) TaxID=423536 RepID=C5LCW9_PERM5|nr:hypothetical protein Pmar_PMAR024885 [Perkinsus marinus ATCC 50983]EER05422.1 hypothetical protein Pmar_PMAR024885 [Perkinsus marinus ATCC 50983]|eukprot:XP_002773606.1 hypothetical protein Pmar_PMAR024885 [Perkinsus marinus ATCC 50983]